MANSEGPRDERRRATTRQWTGPERRSRFAAGAGGQLLERGDDIADPVGALDDDRGRFTGEGERGTNIGDRMGGPVYDPADLTGHDDRAMQDLRHGAAGTDEGGSHGAVDPDGGDDDPEPTSGGTGGQGGFSTLAGGIYAGEGDPDDAPSYGDWKRHSTGATSSGLQHEGFAFPGEDTWGEEQSARERSDEAGDGDAAGRSQT